MFFTNWKKIRQGWQRFSDAGREGSRTSRRKDRQSLTGRNAFRLSPRIEPLEQRSLLAVWSLPADATSIPQGADLYDTSTYAMGTMTWNILFVSTTPDMQGAEVWTEEEMNDVKSSVAGAADLWAAKTADLVPGAHLAVTTKYLTDYGYERDDVPIESFALPDAQMTPGGYPLQPEKQEWINEVLAWIHLDIGGEITSFDDPDRGVNLLNFNNQTRYLNNTNWSATIFFIHDANDNLNDPYPNEPGSIDYDWQGRFREYAYAGGGSSVITQSMAGSTVIMHETGHLMGALDEYHLSGAKYSDFSNSYLIYQNFNCVDEPAGTRRMPESELNWPSTLYLGGSTFLSPPTKHHIGIWDSDYDHIPDILDTPPTIDGTVADSNPGEGTLLLTGSLGVTAFPNPSRPGHDITVNTVAAGYYRINGGEQILLAPDDGAYGGFAETFNLRLDHLFNGTYSIDVTVVNSVGLTATKHFEFTSTLTPPDLSIAKSHTFNFTQGKPNESYTITVSNVGVTGSPTYGKVTVVDTLPAGLTYSNYIGVGWTLDPSSTPSRPVFVRTDVLDKNSTYPNITLFVNVAFDPAHPDTAYTVVNTATVSGGGDASILNNTANDSTVILPPADLTVSKTHAGTFHRGSWSGNTYTVTVTNSGSGGSTIGRVYVEDIMPVGMTGAFVAANGWAVDNSDPSRPKAYRDETLLYGSNFPALTLTVTVSNLAPPRLTNTVIVSGGGESNTSNNTATDLTEILPLPDLAIVKSHIGNFTQGEVGRTYMIIVSNTNAGITDGPVTVTETLPGGLRIRSMSGTGWSVNLATMTATNSTVLNGVASLSPLFVTVDVDFNAPAVVYNVATVSGGGEEENANNPGDFSDNTALDETHINTFLPLQTTGYLYAGTDTLTINFNRTVLGAGNVANFELRNCGADGLLGNADDAIIPMTASYYNGTTTLHFPGLVESVYRLTIRDAITDASGVKIDGNSDGVPGGDWVMDFVVVPGANLLAPATTFSSVGTKPMGIAKGDFNGDGKPDLALANAGSSTTQILLGVGNNAFAVGQTLLAETAAVPYEVTAADFNADGKLDLAVVNYDSLNLNGTLKIYLGVGNGTFASGNTYTWANISPRALVAADLNGDGKLDLAVANYNSGKVTTLFGDGAGAFGSITNYNAGGANPAGIAVGDFNGDGRNDLAVANNDNGTVGIFLNSGGGIYPGTAATYLAGGTHSRGLAVGDFNLDGFTDIAVANFGAVGGSDGGVGILLNFGNGTFPASNIPYFAGGTHPNGIEVVNLNGDDRLDIIVTNSDSGTVGVLTGKDPQGNISGLFNESITYGTFIANGPYDMAIADFNADGKPDLAVTNTNTAGTSNSVTILSNVFGTPTPPAQQTTPKTLNTPHSYAFDVSVSSYGPGQFIDGTNDAFDGYGRLMVGGSLFQPMSGYTEADGNRTIVSPTATISGLSVYRRVTVPNTGNEDFARTVDTFTNPTGSPITATVRIVSNLGSDSATTIFATSSGDTTLTTGDLWFGTDAGIGNVLIHCLRSQYGLAPTAVERVGDNLAWTYVITVPAGQSVELGYFTIQAADRTTGVNAVNALVGANGFGGQAALGLSQADLNALANFQFPKPMNVLASDLPAAGNVNMTLKLGTDGKIHLYQSGTSIDLVAPRLYGAATALNITGRNSFGEILTIDLSGGNPIPAGGMTFNGGTGGGNSIVIAGTSADDAVTMTASQIILNGSTINYANATVSSFQLGGGVNTLTLDHVALSLTQNNAISAGTKVTLDGGTLNYNGYAQNLGDLTLTNGGSVNAGAIDNPASTVSVGSGSTLTATSIVCDSLVIGSSGGAAAGASANLTVNDGQHVNIASFNNPAASIDVQSGGTLTATSIVCDTLAIGSPFASAAAASSAPAMAATPEETASAGDAAVPAAIAPAAVSETVEELAATAIVSAPAPMLSVISTLAAEKPAATSSPVSSPLARAAIFAADAKETAKPASWIQSPRWEMPELAAAAAQVRSATVNRALESMFSDDEDPFQPSAYGKIKRRR